MIGLGLSIVQLAVRQQLAFNPTSLFANGEQGWWYDPSNYGPTGTLFQDSAGTTPVTAVEQPVGLMLDKSQGLVLGPELASVTSWVSASGYQNVTVTSSLVVNRFYQISFLVTSTNNGGMELRVGSTAGGATDVVINNVAAQQYRFILPCDAGGTSVLFQDTTGTPFEGTITNISVKELPGNHAFQSTSASRPVVSARVNLLTKTEDFSDAAWRKLNTTVTANSTTAPDGTTTADTMIASSTAINTGITRIYPIAANSTVLVYAKRGASNFLGLSAESSAWWANFDLLNGTVGNSAGCTASISNAGNGWYACSLTTTTSSDYITFCPITANTTTFGWGASCAAGNSIFIWGASLVPANQSTIPYQRVNTATDYATTGFLPYLKFDGVDDSLSTNSISFTSTDKMSVFAGVRKLSDAAIGAIVGLSASPPGNNGAFELLGPAGAGSTDYRWTTRGTATATMAPTGFSAPITNVLTGIADIGADISRLRINGVQVDTSSSDQGTGNYGNYPLHIGRRGGSSLPFNGQMYSMVIVGKAVTAGELSSTETYVATKTGVAL